MPVITKLMMYFI